jgi:uncharacterized membrane protein YesL
MHSHVLTVYMHAYVLTYIYIIIYLCSHFHFKVLSSHAASLYSALGSDVVDRLRHKTCLQLLLLVVSTAVLFCLPVVIPLVLSTVCLLVSTHVFVCTHVRRI